MNTRYILTAVLMLLSAEGLAATYTIGGSTQTVHVMSDVTNAFEDIAVPGGNFTMFTPIASGIGVILNNPDTPSPYTATGTTEDIVGSLDDSLICFDTGCTDVAMFFSSVTNFSGTAWVAHDIRVFGPGTYDFDTCLNDGSTTCITGGDPTAAATLVVGPGQVGAQVFFDYGPNLNIDVFLNWQPDATFTRPDNNFFQFFNAYLAPAETRTYELASRDVDGDGNAGSAMTDGPFKGHNASFSLFLDQSVPVPVTPTMVVAQAGNSGASTGSIDPLGAAVTVDSGIANAANLVFDWNLTSTATTPKYADGSDMYPASDAALVVANTNGTTSPTFHFDPTNAAIIPGATLTVSVQVTNTDNGLSNGATFSLAMGCPADSAPADQDTDGDGVFDVVEACGDTDKDGILNYLDPSTFTPSQVSIDLPLRTVAESDTGTLSIGALAATVADSAGDVGTGIAVSFADINSPDATVDQSCVGGCFDFTVTGGALGGTGTSAKVVILLSELIPERAIYKKVNAGQWMVFDETNPLDSVNSALSFLGTCPAPGNAAYSNGLVVGDDCVQISIEDNGPNDADTSAGSIADPGGVAQEPVPPEFTTPETKIDGGVFGCSASATPVKLTERGELMLILAFIVWIGLVRGKKHKECQQCLLMLCSLAPLF